MRTSPTPAEQQQPTSGLSCLAWLDRYLSMPLVFGLLSVAIFLIAWNRGITLLYGLFALLMGVILCSVIGAKWMLRQAIVHFSLPRQGVVGEPLQIGIEIAPLHWPARRRLLQLLAPFPFVPEQHVFLPNAGKNILHQQQFICERRGVFTIDRSEVCCAYPIGLVPLRAAWRVQPVCITVYPRVYPISSFQLDASSSRNSAELEQQAPSSGQELFREVREYRRGDNPRHIHWRSSARRGSLVVKQFDAISSREVWIVLDLDEASHAGQDQDHSFERAVEVAASLAHYFSQSGVRCGIAGGLNEDGTPCVLVKPGSGLTHIQSVMEGLACMQVNRHSDYQATLASLVNHYRPGQQWIIFKHGDGRLELPEFLRAHRAPFWFRFDTDSFANQAAASRPTLPPQRHSDGFVISRDTDLGQIFR